MYAHFFSISPESAAAFPAQDRSISALLGDAEVAIRRIESGGSPDIATRLYLLGHDRIRREHHWLGDSYPGDLQELVFEDYPGQPSARIAEALLDNAKAISGISPLAYCYDQAILCSLLTGLERAVIQANSPAARLFIRQGVRNVSHEVDQVKLELLKFTEHAVASQSIVSAHFSH